MQDTAAIILYEEGHQGTSVLFCPLAALISNLPRMSVIGMNELQFLRFSDHRICGIFGISSLEALDFRTTALRSGPSSHSTAGRYVILMPLLIGDMQNQNNRYLQGEFMPRRGAPNSLQANERNAVWWKRLYFGRRTGAEQFVVGESGPCTNSRL